MANLQNEPIKSLGTFQKLVNGGGVDFITKEGEWIQYSEYFDEETAKGKCIHLNKIQDTNES